MRVLFVGHDASRTGAPVSLLRLVSSLVKRGDVHARFLLRRGGELADEYSSVAPLRIPEESSSRLSELFRLLTGRDIQARYARYSLQRWIRQFDPELVFVNSAASIEFTQTLDLGTLPVVCRVAELERALSESVSSEALRSMKDRVQMFIAVSDAVKESLVHNRGIDPERITVIKGALPELERIQRAPRMRAEARARLQAPADSCIIGAVGSHNWQKSPDLFIQLGREVKARSSTDVRFVWIGGETDNLYWSHLEHDVNMMNLRGTVTFVPATPDAFELMSAFDVFVVTSREDSFPLVAIEAASLGKPVVCFAGSGGAPEFVGTECGMTVPFGDVRSMATVVCSLMADEHLRTSLGVAAKKKALEDHDPAYCASRVAEAMRKVAIPRLAHEVPGGRSRINCPA